MLAVGIFRPRGVYDIVVGSEEAEEEGEGAGEG